MRRFPIPVEDRMLGESRGTSVYAMYSSDFPVRDADHRRLT